MQWRGLPQRAVRPVVVAVTQILGQYPAQVVLTESDDMIQALPADRADKALHEGILPRTVTGNQHFLHAHASHPLAEARTMD